MQTLEAEDNGINRIVGAGLLRKANVVWETAANGRLAKEGRVIL